MGLMNWPFEIHYMYIGTHTLEAGDLWQFFKSTKQTCQLVMYYMQKCAAQSGL